MRGSHRSAARVNACFSSDLAAGYLMPGIAIETQEAKMKRLILGMSAALASLTLTACLDDGYGRGGLYWSQYPYSGWYDGYYGPIYDGYWGTDSYFYYRLRRDDQRYYRDGQKHFRRGDIAPGGNYRRFEGTNQQPPQGTRMPKFPREDRSGNRSGNRPGGRDRRGEQHP